AGGPAGLAGRGGRGGPVRPVGSVPPVAPAAGPAGSAARCAAGAAAAPCALARASHDPRGSLDFWAPSRQRSRHARRAPRAVPKLQNTRSVLIAWPCCSSDRMTLSLVAVVRQYCDLTILDLSPIVRPATCRT